MKRHSAVFGACCSMLINYNVFDHYYFRVTSAMYQLIKELVKQNEAIKKDNEELREMIHSIAMKVNVSSPN